MEDTLKELSDLQIQALHKGIAFSISLDYNGEKIPITRVQLEYSIAGDITKGYVFDTTFDTTISNKRTQHKLNSISHFISTVTGPIENE